MGKLSVDIGKMNKRIMIQKQTVTIDAEGNHTSVWQDYFSCYAAINGVSQRDYWNARQQHEENTVTFRMRCCSALKLLNTVDYRIVCSGLIYDITGIDNVLFADSVLNIRGVIKDGESEGD